jgi:hypothetical protein
VYATCQKGRKAEVVLAQIWADSFTELAVGGGGHSHRATDADKRTQACKSFANHRFFAYLLPGRRAQVALGRLGLSGVGGCGLGWSVVYVLHCRVDVRLCIWMNDVGARMGETRAMQGSMLASDGYDARIEGEGERHF